MNDKVVIYERMVQWGDTDAAGIVFYPNYFKWMDEATHHLFRTKGYPQSKLFEEHKTALPILEAHCQFKKVALFENVLRVESRIVEVRDKVFKVSHNFMRGDQQLAEGYEIRAWTVFNGDRPKAVSIPDIHRQWMEAMT